MASKKTILLSLVGLAIICGGIALNSHIKSERQARQRVQASELVAAVAREGENCLKKLAGQYDHIEQGTSPFSTKITSCYLQYIGIEVSAVSEDACVGLAENVLGSDYFKITSVQANKSGLKADACQDNIPLHFELETTAAGKAFFDKMRPENQSEQKNGFKAAVPTAEELADSNAFPDEIISRLNEARQ